MPLLLEIPGVQGSSDIKDYGGWLPIEAFSWSGRRNLAFATAGGYRSGGIAAAPMFSEVVLMRQCDGMTAWLWKMCVQNESFTAKLHWLRTGAGNAPEVYAEMILGSARIIRISDSSAGSSRPAEELVISYGKFEFAHTKFIDALTGVRAVAEFSLNE